MKKNYNRKEKKTDTKSIAQYTYTKGIHKTTSDKRPMDKTTLREYIYTQKKKKQNRESR